MELDQLLRRMAQYPASDLHIKAHGAPVFRINGDLHTFPDDPTISLDMIQTFLGSLLTTQQKEEFYTTREMDLAHSVPGFARFRVNLSWQRGTIALAFRIVPVNVPQLDQLDLPPICRTLANRPRGMVLVTGTTGSGKSTTLAAMVRHINETRSCHIITIEDPIEFLHSDIKSVIRQREVGHDTLSFPDALTHLLRQDPDVVLIGEMRELQTISAALTIAETGHLVLATLHTTSAAQAVDRIVDVFPPNQQSLVRVQLSMNLEGVICQTLVPTVDGKRRVPAVEVLVVNSAARNLIREMKTHQIANIIQTGASQGMQSLDQALASLWRRDIIGSAEALSRANDPDELRRLATR